MQDKSIMYMEYYRVLELWMRNLENEKSIETYFQYHGFHQIALYGMGQLANHVINALKNSDIHIVYGIDRKTDIESEVRIMTLDEKEFPPVDAVLVTPIYDYDNIEKQLSMKMDIPIISLKDVVKDTAIL